MRALLASVLLVGLWTAEAAASSFVVLQPMESPASPSIVTLGEPQSVVSASPPDSQPADTDVTIGEVGEPHELDPADSDIITLSPSVIAMGEPDVAPEKVAAIGAESHKPQREALPVVIRGGVVGDAFSPVSSSPPVTVSPSGSGQEASEAAPRPANQKKPAQQAPEPQPIAPPPVAPPPTSKPE